MVDIHWLGHDGFQVKGKTKTIYIDPFDIAQGLDAADLILITHHHFDHCSFEDIEKISTPDTIIIANKKTLASLEKAEYKTEEISAAKDPLTMQDIKIKAIPAYNTNKHFHPKADEGIGFLITIDDTVIYHAGDTDIIPEMDTIHCDYALIPVSGTYVMDIEDALDATEHIDAKTFIPMHYGKIVGHAQMGEEFKKRCRKHVEVKEIYQG